MPKKKVCIYLSPWSCAYNPQEKCNSVLQKATELLLTIAVSNQNNYYMELEHTWCAKQAGEKQGAAFHEQHAAHYSSSKKRLMLLASQVESVKQDMHSKVSK